MPRSTFNFHRSTHYLRDPMAVRDALHAARLNSDVSGEQLDTAERLIIALRASGARNVTFTVEGWAPNALNRAAQHAASEGGVL